MVTPSPAPSRLQPKKEEIMECKHPYYRMENGERVCAICGELSPNQSQIGDKAIRRHEDKAEQSTERKRRKPRR